MAFRLQMSKGKATKSERISQFIFVFHVLTSIVKDFVFSENLDYFTLTSLSVDSFDYYFPLVIKIPEQKFHHRFDL